MTTYPQPTRFRFTVDEYYKMIELGLLKNCEHSQIIDGELFQKTPIGDLHASTVDFLNRILVKKLADEVHVSVRNPVRLSDYDEPEPDIALSDLTKYDGQRHPRPNEVLLVIEVSDSSVEYDRNIKLPLYAAAEIGEAWLINICSNRIEQHTAPRKGIYSLIRILRRGDMLTSETVPNLSIEVEKIFAKQI